MAQKTKKKSTWWKRLLIILLLVALVAGYVWFFVLPKLKADATVTYDGYTASRGTISNSMDFSGSISVINYETLSAEGNGTVRQIYVSEEQAVKEGDKLIRLSSGETLKANFDGHVNQLNVENGDSVSMGQGLIQIVDFANMQVTFRVDEYDIANIRVGQECRVNVTALGTTFNSAISHINRIPASSQGTAYYTVTADFVVTENVLPGMQVTVVIPQEEAVNAVLLSKNALSFDQRNSAYVLKKDESGSMVETPVEIGMDNDNYVEIISGVTEGETVYAVTETKVTSGLASLFSSMGAQTMPSMPQGFQNGSMGGGGFDPSSMGGGGRNNFGGGGMGGGSFGGGRP